MFGRVAKEKIVFPFPPLPLPRNAHQGRSAEGFIVVRSNLLRRCVLSAALAVGASVLFAADADAPRKAPELSYTVPGRGDELLSQLRGKVVALEFILTTCPHCQEASKLMSQLQRDYGSRGFQALDVAINALEDGRNPAQANAMVQDFATRFQTAFPVGWTPRDQMLAFMGFSMMNRYVVPQLVLIDRKGMIRYQTPPLGDPLAMQPSTIRERIENLLAEGASPARHSGKSAGKSAK